LHKNPVTGANLYRLKIANLNGTISYSNIVTLMYGNRASLVKTSIVVYPNPVQTTLNLNICPGFTDNSGANLLVETPGTTYEIQIANILGVVVIKTTSVQQNWQTNLSSLMTGTYIIKVINNKNNSAVGQATFIKL
jgi:trimeric autotransporter adhesin